MGHQGGLEVSKRRYWGKTTSPPNEARMDFSHISPVLVGILYISSHTSVLGT